MKQHYFWRIKVETNNNELYTRQYREGKIYNKTDAMKELTEQLADDLNAFPFLRVEDISLSAEGTSYNISRLGRTVSIERFYR